MKVTFVRHSLLNRGGDKMIAAYASSLAEAGHQVVLKTNMINSAFTLSSGVIVESLRFSGKTGTILSLLLESLDADMIVADIIPLSFILSIRNRNRVLYFAQDYNENVYSNIIQKLFIRSLYALSFAVLKIPVIAVSAELAQEFARRFGAKATVIHNGVDLDTFYSDPDENLLCQKGDKQAILFFSRRDYRKGFDLALKTVSQLNSLEVVVWTVGEKIDNAEVPCGLHNFGYVNETELRRIMSSADIFLYPSRSEGFGLMPLEAMACGCPVVTTPAVPYAMHEANALVAPIEDCTSLRGHILQIFADETLRNRLIEAGKKFAKSLSLASSSDRFERTLIQIVDRQV